MNRGEGHVPRAAPLRTLLYVEDDPADQKMLAQIIARLPGMRLLAAVNASLGIEIARTSRPEVIVMDINLPDVSGFKALEILRADPATAQIPVIALSANVLPLNVESGLEAGFFRYLTKPIKLDEFVEALNAALAFARQNAARGK